MAREGRQRTLLFAGPSGVGRRDTARWLCALLNCLAAEGARPCGACAACSSAAAGTSLDLKEVEPHAHARSGRARMRPEIGIDQLVLREAPGSDPEPLAPWLAARPFGRRRVGVVAEAETMNAAAANAFLKTLEEPPERSFIVLLAPGPEALLPTVASRALVVRFRAVAGAAGAFDGHPSERLGQPVLVARAVASRDATQAARDAAGAFMASVQGSALQALEGAEDLAKAVAKALDDGAVPGPTGWLRESLRDLAPGAYAVGIDLIEEYEDALSAYANSSLAAARLALELRRALSRR